MTALRHIEDYLIGRITLDQLYGCLHQVGTRDLMRDPIGLIARDLLDEATTADWREDDIMSELERLVPREGLWQEQEVGIRLVPGEDLAEAGTRDFAHAVEVSATSRARPHAVA